MRPRLGSDSGRLAAAVARDVALAHNPPVDEGEAPLASAGGDTADCRGSGRLAAADGMVP